MDEKEVRVRLVFRSMSDDTVMQGKDYDKLFPLPLAQSLMVDMFGVSKGCGCMGNVEAARDKNAPSRSGYWSFADDETVWGLTDCGKVVEGGEYTVTAAAVKAKPEPKPVLKAKPEAKAESKPVGRPRKVETPEA